MRIVRWVVDYLKVSLNGSISLNEGIRPWCSRIKLCASVPLW